MDNTREVRKHKKRKQYAYDYKNTRAFKKENELLLLTKKLLPENSEGDILYSLYGKTISDIIRNEKNVSLITVTRHHPMLKSDSSAVDMVFTIISQNYGCFHDTLENLYNCFLTKNLCAPKYPYNSIIEPDDIYFFRLYDAIWKFRLLYEIDKKTKCDHFCKMTARAISKIYPKENEYPSKKDVDKYLFANLRRKNAEKGNLWFVDFVKRQ